LVRRARYDLLGEQDAILDQPANAVMRDAERRSGHGHSDPLAVLLGGTVSMNAVHPPHRADTARGPGLSLTCRHPQSVQRCRDIRVRPAGRHAAHHPESFVGRAAPVLAGLWLADAQL